MNISQIKFLTKLSPQLRLIIKKFLSYFNKPLNYLLMFNANLNGKIFSLKNGSYSFNFDPDSLKSNIKDENDLPIPSSEYIVGFPSSEWYLESGKEDYKNIIDIIEKSGHIIKKDSKILDFGCSNGRIIRWFYDWTKEGEVWGVDISSEQILWAKTNLMPPFKFITTTTTPHLPFEDNYFDFVYATSVFTHIDDLYDSWLLELRRILKKNGLLYITIQDETSIDYLISQSNIDKYAKAIVNTKECKKFIKIKKGYFSLGRSTYSQVYYELAYFIKIAESYFKLVNYKHYAYRNYQTGILLKKD